MWVWAAIVLCVGLVLNFAGVILLALAFLPDFRASFMRRSLANVERALAAPLRRGLAVEGASAGADAGDARLLAMPHARRMRYWELADISKGEASGMKASLKQAIGVYRWLYLQADTEPEPSDLESIGRAYECLAQAVSPDGTMRPKSPRVAPVVGVALMVVGLLCQMVTVVLVSRQGVTFTALHPPPYGTPTTPTPHS